ncbi:MAG TPA: hypothetical protein VM056_07000 [Terriglobales bacterium]|nr:hypothetical protein [Terriglobales bacterium]
MAIRAFVLLIIATCTLSLAAAELQLPAQVVAGAGITISGGSGTLYISGPGTAIKREIKGGESVTIAGEDLRNAGRYLALLKSGSETTAKWFVVEPGPVGSMNFLARPSRVPVSAPDVISGVAFVFDEYQNLVLQPTPVTFELSVEGGPKYSKAITSKDGIAWIKAGSGRSQGAAQFVASVGSVSARRVVQQVASDPCNIHMKAQRQKDDILVETDPLRDCSGNPVPDGTIVTFIQSGGGKGRSTVDARVKRGTARATLPVVPGSILSVASGVILGNEIRWGGGQ